MSLSGRSLRSLSCSGSLLLSLLHAAPLVAQQQPDLLTLDEVIAAVHANHPALLAADLKQASAQAKVMSADGAFDMQLAAGAEVNPNGKKAYGVLDVTLVQPTTLWGLQLFTGWAGAYGGVPDYKDQWSHKLDKTFTGYKGTNDPGPRGQVHAGVALPILRDGSIDKNRAKRLQARAKLEETSADLQEKRLELELKAADAYWSWVAAGMQQDIAQELLDTATTRQLQIEEKIKQGADAPIYGVENQKYILKRRKKLVKSKQKLMESGVKLSQYWRPNEDAAPVMPTSSQLVTRWPEVNVPEPDAARSAAERAATQRPEWLAFEAQRDAARVNVRLYENQLLPRLDLTAAAAQPLDVSKKTDMRVTLDISSPLQRREARGASESAEADVARIDAELRVFQDQTVADVQNALISLEASQEIAELAISELELTRQLEEAERIKLAEGDSTLLIVNLREQATADAAMSLVDAQKALHMARVKYHISLGKSLLED